MLNSRTKVFKLEQIFCPVTGLSGFRSRTSNTPSVTEDGMGRAVHRHCLTGGWPTFDDVCVHHSNKGCPVLAFFARAAGSDAAVLFDLLRCRAVSDPLAQAFPAPALRKEREGRGTPCVAAASKVKTLGHPPPNLRAAYFEALPVFRGFTSRTLSM